MRAQVFENCAIYTPDGDRLLIRNLSLTLKEGESCLVMGPSGIGKSSVLRVPPNPAIAGSQECC